MPECIECGDDALVTVIHHTGKHPRAVKHVSMCAGHYRTLVERLAEGLEEDADDQEEDDG